MNQKKELDSKEHMNAESLTKAISGSRKRWEMAKGNTENILRVREPESTDNTGQAKGRNLGYPFLLTKRQSW